MYRQNENLKEPMSPTYFLELKKKTTAQLKNVTEDVIFVKIFLYCLLSLLFMLPNVNIK